MNTLANADLLRDLLDDKPITSGTWTLHDLGMILDHQLATKLLTDAAGADGGQAARQRDGCQCVTYGRFLACVDKPCPKVTRLVKEHSKCLTDDNRDFPREVAKVLYLLAVIRAKRMNIPAISTLSDESAKKQIRQTLALGWISDAARVILRQGIAAAGDPPPSSSAPR